MSGRAAAAELAWRVEAVCFNAFPSLKQAILQGWLLRFSKGISRRANSANALGPDYAAPELVIEQIEAIYRGQGQPTIFRVPSFLAGLNESLMARGYRSEGETCVLYGEMDAVAAAPAESVEPTAEPSTEWLAAMAVFQQHSEAQREVYRRMVEAIAVPATFAALRIDGSLAALAYGAASHGLLVYESVITDPARRRQGLAWRVIAAIAAWGREHGARGVCLQVEAGNAPARALYDRFGLSTELYRYRYWRQSDADRTGS
ncbi:MAG: GNAT family N-acetyltransferase [Alphaproteobacteria bacterium]|nr:GNAT family N-acetyltransferase [Alphaproteobacteria bacterium]